MEGRERIIKGTLVCQKSGGNPANPQMAEGVEGGREAEGIATKYEEGGEKGVRERKGRERGSAGELGGNFPSQKILIIV